MANTEIAGGIDGALTDAELAARDSLRRLAALAGELHHGGTATSAIRAGSTIGERSREAANDLIEALDLVDTLTVLTKADATSTSSPPPAAR